MRPRPKQIAQEGATSGQALVWNGTTWVPTTLAGGTTRIAQNGVPTDTLRFFIDTINQSSMAANQLTTVFDTISSLEGTGSDLVFVDGELTYDGTDSLIDFGTLPASLENIWDGGGTACAWFTANGIGGGSGGRLFDTLEPAGSTGWTLLMIEESGGTCRVQLTVFTTGVVAVYKTTDRVITFGEKYFATCSFDSTSPGTPAVFTVNGVVVATTPVGSSTGTTKDDAGQDLAIGNNTSKTRGFDGVIDIAALYDSALVAGERTSFYDSTKGRFGIGTPGTLAATLVQGNITGGTDMIVSDGDKIQGEDNALGTAFDLQLIAGSTDSTNGGHRAGHLLLKAGESTNAVGGADGGDVQTTASTPAGSGGTGGAIRNTTGSGGVGAANANAGPWVCNTGSFGGSSGKGGDHTTILGASALFAVGAKWSVVAGSCTGNSAKGGNMEGTAGQGQRSGGDIKWTTGAKTNSDANFRSGDYLVTVGGLGVLAGDLGNMTWTIPDVPTPASNNAKAGQFTWEGGANGTRNADGTGFTFNGGASYAAGSLNRGGYMAINLGDYLGTSTAGGNNKGGDFNLACGGGGTHGDGGAIIGVAGAGGTDGTHGGDSGDIVWTTQAASGAGRPGLFRVENDDVSNVDQDGQFQVKTNKSEYTESVFGMKTSGATTTDATLTKIVTPFVLPTDNRAVWMTVDIVGVSQSSDDAISRSVKVCYWRNNSGVPALLQTVYGTEVKNGPNTGGWSAAVVLSGSDIFVQVVGDLTRTVNWTVLSSIIPGGDDA